MKLNGKMALILRYFTEFGSVRGTLPKSGYLNKAITMGNLRGGNPSPVRPRRLPWTLTKAVLHIRNIKNTNNKIINTTK